MIDKALAVQLRLQGHKYESIAATLHCSVAWCKKNLKGIRPGNVNAGAEGREDICNKIIQLAQKLKGLPA